MSRYSKKTFHTSHTSYNMYRIIFLEGKGLQDTLPSLYDLDKGYYVATIRKEHGEYCQVSDADVEAIKTILLQRKFTEDKPIAEYPFYYGRKPHTIKLTFKPTKKASNKMAFTLAIKADDAKKSYIYGELLVRPASDFEKSRFGSNRRRNHK